MSSTPDGQKARSQLTQQSLMDAAEKLIASKGLQKVSIKEIIKQAGQKNESVLQYHFKNLQGLIHAIHLRRNAQTQAKRAELLANLKLISTPSLRDICRLMVMPTFMLCKADAKYRRYVSAFSHEIALAEDSALSKVNRSGGGGESGERIGQLLREALPHLDEAAYRQRMEFAVRMSSIAMGHHARAKNAFRGPESDVFVSHLIDALEGLLGAPVSQESREIG